jgi:hypothetical protein
MSLFDERAWNLMTDAEKMENLHQRLLKLSNDIQNANRVHNNLANLVQTNDIKLKEVVEAVEVLRKDQDPAPLPPP